MKNRGLKRHLLASVGFISLAVASSASAGDIAQPSPPAAIWNWSGIYIGAHGGYGWGRDPFSDVVFSGKAPLNGVNSNGFVGGFQAGANWQYGAWVSGLEIDLSATGIKGSSSTSSTLVVGPDSATTTLKQTDKFDLLGSARARLGYLVLLRHRRTRLDEICSGAARDVLDFDAYQCPTRSNQCNHYDHELISELAVWMGGGRRCRDQIVGQQLVGAR